MEKLKFTKLSSILLFVAIASMVVVSSCSDDPPPPVIVDTTVLKASIAEAENLIATTEEGLAEGQYPAGSQAALQTAAIYPLQPEVCRYWLYPGKNH